MDVLGFKSIFICLMVVPWRVPHFHIIHRLMHPWRWNGIPDIGKFLYRKVHALHHKSYNPTAFSGTNMHPIEATLYYTAAFVPILWGNCHPIFALTAIVDCAVGAWLGHDGFQWPGAGDYYHLLHHKYFDCNYSNAPIDWIFGTFAGDKNEVRKIWGRAPCDSEKNEIHPSLENNKRQ